MVSMSSSIIYEQLSDFVVQEVSSAISLNFSIREPISKSVGATPKMLEKLFLPILSDTRVQNFAWVAKHHDLVVGAIICGVFEDLVEESSTLEQYDESLRPIVSLLGSLEQEFLLKNQPHKKQILYQYATYVNEEFANRGIATNLYTISEKQAKDKGFKKLITISTGPISQYIRRNKLNFINEIEAKYSEFVFQDELPFASIEGVDSCVLLSKSI